MKTWSGKSGTGLPSLQRTVPVEDVKHYFLSCPMYAAHRIALFTSAAQLLGDEWRLASDKKKIECFLFGSPDLQFQSNVRLFEQVQCSC